ncbi:MAG: hypothetical protein ACOYXT_30285 [Bacteroidota bacterium]
MKVYFEHIYEHIGYLFYALARAHGKLNEVSFDKLNQLIDQQWSSDGNTQNLESHMVNYLRSGLRNAFDTAMSAGAAYDHFKSYYDIHSTPFGSSLRSKILATADSIAAAFSGNGKKSEFLAYLEKLLSVNPISST